MKWSPLAEKVHQFLIHKNLLKQHDKILLAVSGGVDSVVMLSVFLELKRRWNWELVVGHIDHGLRPGADEKESRLCRELAEKNSLCYIEEKIDLTKQRRLDEYSKKSTQNPSLESLARDARYRIFEKWVNELHCNAVCTAHHANDQAETVLYRMLTGAGIKGLIGIPVSRDFIVRPLLSVLRQEIENYAQEKELDYFEDHSNTDEKFVRNRIRHSILPVLTQEGFPYCEKALADSGLALEAALDVIDHYTKLETNNIINIADDKLIFSIKAYLKLPTMIQKQMIRHIFKNNLHLSKHLSEKQLDQINTFIECSDTGNTLELFGYEFVKDRQHMIIIPCGYREINKVFPCKESDLSLPDNDIKVEIKIMDVKGSLKADLSTAYFSMDMADKECRLRNWRSGDTMTIYGSGYPKKISDILKDEKVSVLEKRNHPVILADDEIVWTPGVKRSDLYKVHVNDDKCIMMTYKHGAIK